MDNKTLVIMLICIICSSCSIIIATGVGAFFLIPEDNTSVTKTKNTSPSSSAPAPAKVTFYEHCDFAGNKSELGVGKYNINEMGIANDTISSFKIPKGYSVTLYQHGDFGGDKITVDAYDDNVDERCRVDFDDTTSSIEISKL